MSSIKNLLGFILNPRFQYDKMPELRTRGDSKSQGETPAGRRNRPGYKSILGNFPLVFGGIIVLILFLIVLIGPLLAPINPYIAGKHIVPHFDSEKEEWISPPLSPSPEYPLGTDEWGNDILSMLLYGARNTLVACAFITMVRLILGLALGAYAGWNEGLAGDQTIMGTISVILAVPMLVSSMILIYAMDIRRGLPVFIIALSVIGWTEIAQYIRSEFIVLKKMPFIEGARAVGARNSAIAIRHVLPNILPQLLVITFLELGAVLMLLGELAFIGVFIGGGSRIALGDETIGISVITQSNVPEWGAMLAEGYRWLRAKPFIVFPPAFAFFISVIGFNAFGEGLRRLIETYHVSTNFLLQKRMLVVIGILSFATIFIINNTGPAPWFEKVAKSFNGNSAYLFTETLVSNQGRGAGQEGIDQASAFIIQKFQEYDIYPGWSHSTYIFPLETQIVRPKSQPVLQILDDNGQLVRNFHHQLDFGFLTEGHAGSGYTTASLTYIGFDKSPTDYSWEMFKGLDLRDRIVILLEGSAPEDFVTEALIRGASGVIWIVEDSSKDIYSQYQMLNTKSASLVKPTIPVFRVRPELLHEIIGFAGISIANLEDRKIHFSQMGPGWYTIDLNLELRMLLELGEPKTIEIPCVIGYLPGSDYILANEMVVILANFDGLGIDPNGTEFQGANHNASSIGIMLELARLWQEQELDPRRMVLFIAWGGGQFENPGIEEFLSDSSSFRYLPATSSNSRRQPNTIFQLDNTGAGEDALAIHPDSNQRLSDLLESTATDFDIAVITQNERRSSSGELVNVRGADTIYLSWHNGNFPPNEDRIEKIQAEKLQKIGEIISLALTKIVRENSY